MKYVSLDIETTCLRPSPDHILMVSMVVEDTLADTPVEELPHFTAFVNLPHVSGDVYALAMNGWILEIIAGRTDGQYPVLGFNETWAEAHRFLTVHFGPTARITAAGKNVAGFDLPFLPRDLRDRFRHRVIDPGSLFLNFREDKAPPDLLTCLTRAGIDKPVAHDAREDAMDVIRLLRTRY